MVHSREGIMQELLPVVIGLVLGCVCLPVTARRARHSMAILLSFLGGALATTINWEWAAGPIPFLLDVALVAGGAVPVLTVWVFVCHQHHVVRQVLKT
jgi:hypothetical protein